MWPFNRKTTASTSIIDDARGRMDAECKHHEAAMRHYEKIAKDASSAFHEHEAAYLAYSTILERVNYGPTPMPVAEAIAFNDAEFDAAMTNADADPLAELEASLNPNNELDAAFLKDIADRKAGTERKRKLPKATGAAAAC